MGCVGLNQMGIQEATGALAMCQRLSRARVANSTIRSLAILGVYCLIWTAVSAAQNAPVPSISELCTTLTDARRLRGETPSGLEACSQVRPSPATSKSSQAPVVDHERAQQTVTESAKPPLSSVASSVTANASTGTTPPNGGPRAQEDLRPLPTLIRAEKSSGNFSDGLDSGCLPRADVAHVSGCEELHKYGCQGAVL